MIDPRMAVNSTLPTRLLFNQEERETKDERKEGQADERKREEESVRERDVG